jgi:hypothetical protein
MAGDDPPSAEEAGAGGSCRGGAAGAACTVDDAADAASTTALTAINPVEGCRNRCRPRPAGHVNVTARRPVRRCRALLSLVAKPFHPFDPTRPQANPRQ